MYPTNDSEYEEVHIAKVESDAERGWTIGRDDGWSFGVPKDSPVVPVVGQVARFYGRGIGFQVRGLFLGGEQIYYRTETEQKELQRKSFEARNEERREEFERNKDGHDVRIAMLPAPFRARLAKLQASGPDWRLELESYELFCCEEAVRLVDHARAACGIASPSEWVSAFAKASVESQKKLAPTMKIGEHSGNTFGCAVMLARAYLEDETLIPKVHGALAPLVGCKEYGCHRG